MSAAAPPQPQPKEQPPPQPQQEDDEEHIPDTLEEAGALEADIGASFDHQLASIDPRLRLEIDPLAHQEMRAEMMFIRHELSQAKLSTLATLDAVSPLVRRGGRIAWSCAGPSAGSYKAANEAFDAVLKASLHHVATTNGCEAVWIGRCERVEDAAERIVDALVPLCYHTHRFSLRNAASKIGGFFGRWLKIAT